MKLLDYYESPYGRHWIFKRFWLDVRPRQLALRVGSGRNDCKAWADLSLPFVSLCIFFPANKRVAWMNGGQHKMRLWGRTRFEFHKLPWLRRFGFSIENANGQFNTTAYFGRSESTVSIQTA